MRAIAVRKGKFEHEVRVRAIGPGGADATPATATWTVDRFGRKFLFIVGGIGMGICMIVAATVETQTPTIGGAKTQPVGIAIVFLMFLFAFFCKSLFALFNPKPLLTSQ